MNPLSESLKLAGAIRSHPLITDHYLESMPEFAVSVLATKRFLAMEFPTHLRAKDMLCKIPPIFSQKIKALKYAQKVVSLCNYYVFVVNKKLQRTVCSFDWLCIVLKDSPNMTHFRFAQKETG